MGKDKFVWDIRSKNGKITEENEWAKDLAEHIGKVCLEHGKGFIFKPFGGSNMTCRTFFATSLTDKEMFGAGVASMLSNYVKHNPEFKTEADVVQWVGSIMVASLEVYKGEKDGTLDDDLPPKRRKAY